MSLSEAINAGFVVDRFELAADSGNCGRFPEPPPSALSIHYVGTAGWKDQSSGYVLLHGGSGDWRHYCSNLQRLSETKAVLAPDLPGFGASDIPASEELAAIAGPIASFVGSLPWSDITLVGFSFGALIAAAAAVECRPSRLMLVSPAGFGPHTPEMGRARAHAAQVAREEGVRAGLAVNLHQIMLHQPHALGDGPLLTVMEQMLYSTRAKVRRFSRSELILDRLRLIDCPVRVLFGEFDPYHASVLMQRGSDISVACPTAQIETVKNAAHWLMLDRPELFEASLVEFSREWQGQ